MLSVDGLRIPFVENCVKLYIFSSRFRLTWYYRCFYHYIYITFGIITTQLIHFLCKYISKINMNFKIFCLNIETKMSWQKF